MVDAGDLKSPGRRVREGSIPSRPIHSRKFIHIDELSSSFGQRLLAVPIKGDTGGQQTTVMRLARTPIRVDLNATCHTIRIDRWAASHTIGVDHRSIGDAIRIVASTTGEGARKMQQGQAEQQC